MKISDMLEQRKFTIKKATCREKWKRKNNRKESNQQAKRKGIQKKESDAAGAMQDALNFTKLFLI